MCVWLRAVLWLAGCRVATPQLSAQLSVPGADVYRQDGWGNWASSYSSARHGRWSAIYSEIFSRWNTEVRATSRVVAVITTTPARIAHIQVVIDSVLGQSYKADTFYIFVPHIFQRDSTAYVVPDWLDQYHAEGKVVLVRCDDRGPGTDVLGALELERDPDTYIFKLDDDQVYGKDTLNLLIRAAAIMPGRAISADSTQYYPHMSGLILQGVHGMIFQRKLFDDSIFDYSVAGNMSKHCWLHDDLWYTMHFAKKGIRRESLEMRLETRALELAWGESALYQGGAGTDNYQNVYLCNAAVLQAYPNLWVPRYHVVLIVVSDGTSLEMMLKYAVAQTQRPHHVHGFGFEGYKEQRVGGWMDGILVTLHDRKDCGKCDVGAILEVAINIEEESETVLVSVEAAALTMPTLVELNTACATALTLESAPPKCEHGGALAFWRGTIGPGGFLINATQPIFDKPRSPGKSPAVTWGPMEAESMLDMADSKSWILQPEGIQHWRESSPMLDGKLPAFVAVLQCPEENVEWAEIVIHSILAASMVPDRLYLALHSQTGQEYKSESFHPDVKVIEVRGPLEGLEAVRRKEGTNAFILSLPMRKFSRSLMQVLLSFAIIQSGNVIGDRAIRYRGVGPILVGTALYPPGYLDAYMPQEGREKCKGAEDLWLWASLNGRGVRALGIMPDWQKRLSQSWTDPADAFLPDTAWGSCFEHIWPILGLRLLQLPQPQPRVAVFVRPPDSKFLRKLTPRHRNTFVKQWAELDVTYLLHQARRPGAVYILEDGTVHGHVNRWAGGLDGFEIRLLSCGKCGQRDQFMAAMGVEWHEDTLLLFITAERLLSDQVILENLRCSMRMLVGDVVTTKYCGYYMHMRGDRFVEMAMLRKQLNYDFAR